MQITMMDNRVPMAPWTREEADEGTSGEEVGAEDVGAGEEFGDDEDGAVGGGVTLCQTLT